MKGTFAENIFPHWQQECQWLIIWYGWYCTAILLRNLKSSFCFKNYYYVLYTVCTAHFLTGWGCEEFTAIPCCLKCERMRERYGNVVVLHSFLLTSNAEIIQPYFIACVTWEKEKQDETKILLVMRDLYRPTDTANGRKLKDIISCKPVFVLRHQVFWGVAPCVWVIASERVVGKYCLYLQGYESVNWLVTLQSWLHWQFSDQWDCWERTC